MINSTKKIVKEVYNNLCRRSTRNVDQFSISASSEIDRILFRQKVSMNNKNGNAYEYAGFQAKTITSMIVQKQLALS